MHDWNSSDIASIKIRSLWTDLATPPYPAAETVIEKWGESFLATDTNNEKSGDYAERRAVAADLIDQLVQSLDEPPITEPDPVNMGITPEWFQENIGKLIDDAAEGYSDGGKRRFAERVGHYEFYCGQILNDFHWERTDDHPEMYVRVEDRSGQIEELYTSSQHYFMLPWQLGRRKTGTFNCHISRAVAALLPDGFLNKDCLLYRRIGFGGIHDEYDDLLDVPERSVPGHSRWICRLFFTPDGKSLISGGMDNVVKVWDPRDWTERHCFDMPRVGVNLSVDLAPNGTTLTFNDASVIKIADIQTGHIIRELRGHTWVVRRLIFSTDGTQLASEDREGVRLWDVGSGKELGNEPGEQMLGFSDRGVESGERVESRRPITSPDGRTQVSVSDHRCCGQTVEILDLTTRQTFRRFVTKGIETIALPPDGRSLVTGHFDGHLAVWQLPDR